MPGEMRDGPEADLTLRVLRAAAAPGDDPGSLRVLLDTTRGEIRGIFHPVEGGTAAVVCVGGAMGGLDGPADALYRRIPVPLAERGISVLRLDYRHPNELEECVLDTLAGCSFLRGIGATELALMGHSFGGAVAIRAAQLSSVIGAVVSLSPQLHGTAEVDQLTVPLLLVHGTADTILNYAASEDIYRRATGPKRIVLYEGAGHGLFETKDAIEALLLEWLPARLKGEPMESGRDEVPAT